MEAGAGDASAAAAATSASQAPYRSSGAQLADKWMWGDMGGDRGGGHLTIKIDSTDHLNLEHGACGKSMDIRIMKPEYVNYPDGDDNKIVWFEVNCLSCQTGWVRWRKTVLYVKQGEYVPPHRRST